MSARADSIKKDTTNITDKKNIAEGETITYEMLRHATLAQIQSIASLGIKSAAALEADDVFCSAAGSGPSSSVCANAVDVDYGDPTDLTSVANIANQLVFNHMVGVIPVVMERFYATQVSDLAKAQAILTERAARSILFCIDSSAIDQYSNCGWNTLRSPWLDIGITEIPAGKIKQIIVPQNLVVDLSSFSGASITKVPQREMAFRIRSGYIGNKLVTPTGDIMEKTFTLSLPDYETAVKGILQTARDSQDAKDKKMIFHAVRLPTPMDLHYNRLKKLSENRFTRYLGPKLDNPKGLPFIGTTESLLTTIIKDYATIFAALEECFRNKASVTETTTVATTNADANQTNFPMHNLILNYLFSSEAMAEMGIVGEKAAAPAGVVKSATTKPKH